MKAISKGPTQPSAFTEFFGDAGSFTVEARGSDGSPANAGTRHAITAMGGLRKLAMVVAIGASATLTSLGATAGTQAGLPTLTEDDASTLAMKAIGPNARNLDMLSITSRVLDGSPGPTAQVRDGKRITCTITINDINSAAATMAMSDAQEAPEKVARMREFIVVHEAAHCDHFGSVAAAKRAASAGKPVPAITGTSFTYGDLAAMTEQLESSSAKRFGKGFIGEGLVSESLGESYADTKAMLFLAARSIGKASTPEDLAKGLSDFNGYADDIIAFRAASKANDFLHDSSSLIQSVKAYVNVRASSTEGLSALREDAFDANKMSGLAMKWAVIETLNRSDDMTRHAAQEVVNIVAKGNLPQNLKYLQDAEPQMAKLLKTGERLGFEEQDFSGNIQAMVADFSRAHKAMKTPDILEFRPAAIDPNDMPGKLRQGSPGATDGASNQQPDKLNKQLMNGVAFVDRMMTNVLGFKSVAEKEMAKLKLR